MSEVSAVNFRDRLLTAFDAYWADRTQLALPNVPFDPEGLDSWVRVYILGGSDGATRLSTSVSRDHFIRSGIVTFEVYVKLGMDLDLAYAHAELICRFLKKPGVDDALFSDITQPQELGPDGAWYQVSVSANWRYLTDIAA